MASLQHHGCYTLGLARRLGSVSLANCREPNAIYFNTIGSHMAVYPKAWGKWIVLATAGFFAAVLLFGLARCQLTVTGILAGMVLYLLSAVFSLIVTVPLAALVYFLFHEHALYRNNSLSAALILLGLGILVLLSGIVRQRIRPQHLLAGALAWWLVVLAALQYFAPYGSYAAAWPLASISLGLLALCFSRDPERPSNGLLVVAALTTLPAIVLLVPSYVMFSYAVTALLVPAVLLLILLLVATLLPQMSLIPRKIHTAAGVVLILAGALLFTAACVTNTPSPKRPRQNCLSYAVNFDTGEAWWISGDAKLDKWTRTFFEEDDRRFSLAEFLGYDNGPRYRQAAAPMPPFGRTVLNLIEDRVENGRRTLKLFIDSPRDAQEVCLGLESDVPVYRARAFGIDVEGAANDWDLRLETIPFEGGEIEIETEPSRPLKLRVNETSYELPDIPGFRSRPLDMMTQPNRVLDRRYLLPSNHTYSICTYTF